LNTWLLLVGVEVGKDMVVGVALVDSVLAQDCL
jgi:hypothetical protein